MSGLSSVKGPKWLGMLWMVAYQAPAFGRFQPAVGSSKLTYPDSPQ